MLSHRGITPTGVNRCGDCRSADLGSVLYDALLPTEATPERACSSDWNRLVRSRMPGGVGRAVSDDRPYPIYAVSDAMSGGSLYGTTHF